MTKHVMPSPEELADMDRVYREGGLRQMATPHIHYREPKCPHPDCDHRMEWIDFQLELCGDRKNVHDPLVRAWWTGVGFAGRCPQCRQWIHFTTLGMTALTDDEAAALPKLPDDWHTIAQFA